MTERAPILLASASPRRRELLARLGVEFTSDVVDMDESCLDQEQAEICVQRLASGKSRLALDGHPDKVVIGADTMVVKSGEIFGKPKDRADGLRMLECLSGSRHEVMTAVTIMDGRQQAACLQRSEVVFRALTPDEMEAYWETGEPVDKAGGYAIQGLAASFICELKGSYSGVMGLPLYETVEMLRQFGYEVLSHKHA